MLGTTINDEVESSRGTVRGLGLLPVSTTFGAKKVLARPQRSMSDGTVVEGYEIHHGKVTVHGFGSALENDFEPFFADEGCRSGAVAGTLWHGLFENDAFRRRYLSEVAERAGREFVASTSTCFSEKRELMIEMLADLVEEHVDIDALLGLLHTPDVGTSLHAPLSSLEGLADEPDTWTGKAQARLIFTAPRKALPAPLSPASIRARHRSRRKAPSRSRRSASSSPSSRGARDMPVEIVNNKSASSGLRASTGPCM